MRLGSNLERPMHYLSFQGIEMDTRVCRDITCQCETFTSLAINLNSGPR